MRCFKIAVGLTILAIACATSSAAEQRLTDDGRLKFTPLFRDGGKEIVFVELVNPALFQIRRMPFDGRPGAASQPLHADGRTSEFEPGWAADGECYAYLKTRGVLSVSVLVRD